MRNSSLSSNIFIDRESRQNQDCSNPLGKIYLNGTSIHSSLKKVIEKHYDERRAKTLPNKESFEHFIGSFMKNPNSINKKTYQFILKHKETAIEFALLISHHLVPYFNGDFENMKKTIFKNVSGAVSQEIAKYSFLLGELVAQYIREHIFLTESEQLSVLRIGKWIGIISFGNNTPIK